MRFVLVWWCLSCGYRTSPLSPEPHKALAGAPDADRRVLMARTAEGRGAR